VTLSFTNSLPTAFLTPAPRLFTTTVAAVGVVCSAVTTAYWGQAVTCTVTPTAAPERGNLIFTPTLTGVGSLSVPSLTFTTIAAQTFIYNAPPASGGSASITYALSGSDAWQFTAAIAATPFNVVATGGVSVSCSPGPTLAYGRQSICTVAPLVNPALALIISPTVVGMGGGSVSPTSRTYPVGSIAAQTFIFTASSPSGSLALHFPLSGAGRFQFITPTPWSFLSVSNAINVVCSPALNSILYFGQTAKCVLSPTTSPPSGQLGVGVSLSGGGTVSTAAFSFASPTSQSFVYTAGPLAGPVVISYPFSGADSFSYQLATPSTFMATALTPIDVTCAPAGPALAWDRSSECMLTPGALPAHGLLVVSMVKSGDGGATVVPSSLTFTDMSAQSFVLTTLAPAGPVTVQFVLSDVDSPQFVTPSNLTLTSSDKSVVVTCAPNSTSWLATGRVATCVVQRRRMRPKADS
jgi:hypothetical protein